MIFYPILKAPDCQGYTTLSNFPPNNWEVKQAKPRHIHVTWLQDGFWHTEYLQTMAVGEFLTLTSKDLSGLVPNSSWPLLSILESKEKTIQSLFPDFRTRNTLLPSWRASLGLRFRKATTSYQGEIEPFPEKASLLTFSPFIQENDHVRNYLLLLNLNKSCTVEPKKIEVMSPVTRKIVASYEGFSNGISIIDLNTLAPEHRTFPMIICRDMAAIPLYLSMDKEGRNMSLEHTHPPASLVIHGNRWAVQRALKENWLGGN